MPVSAQPSTMPRVLSNSSHHFSWWRCRLRLLHSLHLRMHQRLMVASWASLAHTETKGTTIRALHCSFLTLCSCRSELARSAPSFVRPMSCVS